MLFAYLNEVLPVGPCLCGINLSEGPLQAAGASSDPPPPYISAGTSAWTGTAAFSQEAGDRWTAVYWIAAHAEELNWAS